jgi:hypothetical protein
LLSGRDDSSGPYNRPSQAGAASLDQRPAANAEDYGQQAEISDEDIPF